MGIHGLSKVIAEHASDAVKESILKNYFGRKIVIDASMSLYQFMISLRTISDQLTDESGESTGHLSGMFYRTVRLIENGVKPIYVFDGTPPEMKSHELNKRTFKREEATAKLEAAKEEYDDDTAAKMNKRLVKVTSKHVEESKKLLALLGVPYVDAVGEAEATCSVMVKKGLAYAVATEDMDTLAFGAPVLIRNFTASDPKKFPPKEYHLDKVLNGLEMNMSQFVDFCILLGCDYCDTIRGIGPHKAKSLISQFSNIETIIENIDAKKFTVPIDWKYKHARDLFNTSELEEMVSSIKLSWKDPDLEGLKEYMVSQKGFSEERITNGVLKIKKARSSGEQERLDSFFKRKEPSSDLQKNNKVVAKKPKIQKSSKTGTKVTEKKI